jgi:uroporphyrinogen-III synthase
MSGDLLAGLGVLVTRPAGQADEFVAAIEEAGGEAYRFPVIRISGRDPGAVANDFQDLPDPDIIIFVSRNAVQYGLDATRGSCALTAAIGPATAIAIENAGIDVDVVPEGGFDSEHLLMHPLLQDVDSKAILIIRGESGRELLGDTLKMRGARVDYLAAYRREPNEAGPDEIARLDDAWRTGRIGCVTVMSVETLENLLQLLPPALLERLRQTPLVAPGERVIQTAMELVPGIPAILASGPRAADMLNALKEVQHSGQNQ